MSTAPAQQHDWHKHGRWLDEWVPWWLDDNAPAPRQPRVHNFYNMTPDSAARAYARVIADRDMLHTAGNQLTSAQSIAGPPILANPKFLEGYDDFAQEHGIADGDQSAPAANGSPAEAGNALSEAQVPAPAAQADPGRPTTPAPDDSSLLDMPDTAGHDVGSTWTGTTLDGRPVTYSIPEGNGTNTVDLEITNADGTVDRWRIARGEGGELVHWHDDANGESSYAERASTTGDWYIESYSGGTPTSGAPSRVSGATANLETTYQPVFDGNGDRIGVNIGTANDAGLYDNEYHDVFGNVTYGRTVANAGGGYDNVLAGEVDHTGHGWRADGTGQRWDIYPDGKGVPVWRRINPETKGYEFQYAAGVNVVHELRDASGRVVNMTTYDPAGTVLATIFRTGNLFVTGKPGEDGKFTYNFRNESDHRRGELFLRPDGGYRLNYEGYAVEIIDAAGNVTDRFNRQGGRGFVDYAKTEFAIGVGSAAVGALEGIGAIVGSNELINKLSRASGSSLRLTTHDEAIDGLAAGIGEMVTTNFRAMDTVARSTAGLITGTETWGSAWREARRDIGANLNANSKFWLGADWEGASDHFFRTFGQAGFGAATFMVPTKGLGAIGKTGTKTPTSLGGSRIPPNVSSGAGRNLFRIRTMPRIAAATDWVNQVPGRVGARVRAEIELAGEGLTSLADQLLYGRPATVGAPVGRVPTRPANTFATRIEPDNAGAPGKRQAAGGRSGVSDPGQSPLHVPPSQPPYIDLYRHEADTQALERGSQLEQRVREALRQTKVKSGDVNKVIERMANHPAGKELAEAVASGRFTHMPNMAQVVSSIIKPDSIPGALEQIRLAGKLLDGEVTDISFEIKGGVEIKPGVKTQDGTDLDVMARDSRGDVYGWQFKNLESTNPKKVIDMMFKEARQLVNSGADVKTFVLDTVVPLRELEPYFSGLSRLHRKFGMQSIVRASDGDIFFPSDGRFDPR